MKLLRLHKMPVACLFAVRVLFRVIPFPVEFVEYRAFQDLFISIRIIWLIEQAVE